MSGDRTRRGVIGASPAAALYVASAAILAVTAVAAAGFGGGPGEPADERTGERPPLATTQIRRETLVDQVAVKAELGYGAAQRLQSRAAGTLTWLAPVGTTVNRGQALLRADDRPVVLLIGPLPAYRELAKGVVGQDVKQFERNLRDLGFTGFTVDATYDAATETAVKRWQKRLDLEPTGTVDPGRIVYLPAAVRIAEHLVRPGAAATGEVLSHTGVDRVVTAPVKVAESGWARPSVEVAVALPDGREVTGVVSTVGRDASAESAANSAAGSERAEAGDSGGNGSEPATVSVTMTVADQPALGAFDRAPVVVRYVRERKPDVLTVPSVALLALAEGGYGIEVPDGAGWRIVPVEAGLFAGGRVEIRGPGLDAGMTVRTPE